MTDRSFVMRDVDGNVQEWEPGGGPALSVFAPLADQAFAAHPEDEKYAAIGDEAGRLMVFSNIALGRRQDPADPAMEWVGCTGRDQALALAGQFIDGEWAALDRYPWQPEPPEPPLIYDDRFHPVAEALDVVLLEMIDELLMSVDVTLATEEVSEAEFYRLPVMPWRELYRRAILVPPALEDVLHRAWRGELADAQRRGVRPDPVQFCRSVTDRHMRFDGPTAAPLYGEPVTFSVEAAGGRVVRALASPALAEPARALLANACEHLPEDGRTRELRHGPQTFRLRPDPDGSVTVLGFDLSADMPSVDSVEDLSAALAWTADAARLVQRAGSLEPDAPAPRAWSWVESVLCQPGWESSRLVEVRAVTPSTGVPHMMIAPRGGETVGDRAIRRRRAEAGAEDDEAARRDRAASAGEAAWLRAWEVLQRRPVAATALGIQPGTKVVIEDDWVRTVWQADGHGGGHLVARGPAWSMLRTIGWRPAQATRWSMPDLEDSAAPAPQAQPVKTLSPLAQALSTTDFAQLWYRWCDPKRDWRAEATGTYEQDSLLTDSGAFAQLDVREFMEAYRAAGAGVTRIGRTRSFAVETQEGPVTARTVIALGRGLNSQECRTQMLVDGVKQGEPESLHRVALTLRRFQGQPDPNPLYPRPIIGSRSHLEVSSRELVETMRQAARQWPSA